MNESCSTGESRPGTGEEEQPSRRAVRVCLLGASFETGNLGVSALAESSVKCILARWPNAQVTLLGGGREEGEHRLEMYDREVVLQKVPIRFCKNVFLSCHFCVVAFWSVVLRVLPLGAVRSWVARRNSTMAVLLDADLFVDISGGDSFSDIYGMKRLVLGFLTRLLPLILKKDLVMFPQTYGPFKRGVSRYMARYILKRCRRVYSRDRAGLEYVKGLLGKAATDDKVRFSPDVAFVLDPKEPGTLDIGELDHVRTEESVVVGLNVSGLIYYGGYTGKNEFGLKVDYEELVDGIVKCLLAQEETLVLLVPHVIPTGRYKGDTENDLAACLDVHNRLSTEYPNRLFVARGQYDQGQAKYIVGMCDFFLGTRMHSCIAALSQCIPAVGVAYSKKFKGVFETVGVEDLVVEMRFADQDEIIAFVENAFRERHAFAGRLEKRVPIVKKQVLALLENIGL